MYEVPNKKFKCKPGCPYGMLYEDMLLKEEHLIQVIEDLLELNQSLLEKNITMANELNKNN